MISHPRACSDFSERSLIVDTTDGITPASNRSCSARSPSANPQVPFTSRDTDKHQKNNRSLA
jgi:hypothetical protein